MLFILFPVFIYIVEAVKVKHDVSWNPDITEKLSFGNVFQYSVKIGEYMDIICPQYDVDEINIMKFVIYNVTKQVFESCGKINDGAIKLLNCNRPTKTTKLTMKFQKFSPNPSGLIFIPGESYYLMAYSNDNQAKYSLENCENKMRMRIKVRPKRKHSHVKKTENFSTTTTILRTSPKLLLTKPYQQPTTQSTTTTTSYIKVKQAGLYKGKGSRGFESSSIVTSSNVVTVTASLIVAFFIT